MSDHFYGVHFCSTKTAVHAVMIFSLEVEAKRLLDMLKTTAENPNEDDFQPSSFVECFDIDFRDPIREYEGVEILYVNQPENSIPDIHNFWLTGAHGCVIMVTRSSKGKYYGNQNRYNFKIGYD